MGYIPNPKMVGSNLLGCAPQNPGRCPQNCRDCYAHHPGAYLDLDRDLPNIPTPYQAISKIVRVNDLRDSGDGIALVWERTKHFWARFYNTSMPSAIGQFDAPEVLTANPPGRPPTLLSVALPTLMAVRIRVNTWDHAAQDPIVAHYARLGVDIILTPDRFSQSNDPHRDDYEFADHVANPWWMPRPAAVRALWERYLDANAGAPGNIWLCGCIADRQHLCRNCRNCETLYARAIKRPHYPDFIRDRADELATANCPVRRESPHA